ncbi:MAG: MBL fold metallo-hydrolase [Pyrinomonas sp.]|uniref:rhodanese-like domain-containing protein n=1 Tax=Pyrinomonas sp. TaxID=2080306 RepID=UPI00332CD388
MFFRQLYDERLAQASYFVACQATGEAVVIDPNRDVEQYLELAERHGFRLAAVTETHIHADFVSGARELAQRTGAKLFLSGAGPREWQYEYAEKEGATLLEDGASFRIGKILFEALHTPGHTPEHLSFVLKDEARASEPVGIFTGDFVFVGDVGRPDLLERAAGVVGAAEEGARQLFRSLAKFRSLPDYVQVWPGHGAGSACGRALGAMPQSTVGYERRFNWAFKIEDEAEFVRAVLDGQPDSPPYFAVMKRVNKRGPTPVAELAPVEKLGFESLSGALGRWIIADTRRAEDYARRHIPGTINLPFNGSFVTWAGWLLPYDAKIGLIIGDDAAGRAVRALRLIGLDQIAGFWSPEVIEEWEARGGRLHKIERLSADRAQQLIEKGEVHVLDVRREDERARGQIAGSLHLPLGELIKGEAELPTDKPLLVHCQTGTRSALAVGLLSARGMDHLIDLEGGFAAWERKVNEGKN